MSRIILGCDPGASGAIAFLNVETAALELLDVPSVQVKRGKGIKREISSQMLAGLIRARRVDIAILEKVGAMPNQGTSSMWQFGRSFGVLEGVLAGLQVPVSYVTPQAWQKAVGVRDGKDGSRARAAELFPAYAQMFVRVKDHNRSDAALIAYWGAMQ